MLENYLPILIFIIIGAGFGLLPLLASWLLVPRKPNPTKSAPYECGFPEFESARIPFDVRYYLVAILFIIFDLETAFLVPWAVVIRHIGWPGLMSMGLFIGLLLLGFVYEWKTGALEWD